MSVISEGDDDDDDDVENALKATDVNEWMSSVPLLFQMHRKRSMSIYMTYAIMLHIMDL